MHGRNFFLSSFYLPGPFTFICSEAVSTVSVDVKHYVYLLKRYRGTEVLPLTSLRPYR